MNNRNLQYRHSFIYGIVIGAIISLYLLLLFIFGMMNNKAMSNLAGIMFVIGGYISIRHFRNTYQEGFITYGKAYGTGLLTFIAAGFIWSIYEYILYKFLSPGLLEEKLAEAQDALLQLGWDESKVEAFTTLSQPTVFTNALGYLINTIFWGALISLLLAAILKREGNPLISQE